jgi:hypothetical protein
MTPAQFQQQLMLQQQMQQQAMMMVMASGQAGWMPPGSAGMPNMGGARARSPPRALCTLLCRARASGPRAPCC